MHHRILWILQWLLGLFFIGFGILHFIVPDGLPIQLSWMYELDETLHVISGTAEILGGIGLILPSLVKMWPVLTPLAAIGLILVMVGAVIFHVPREEFQNVGANVLNILLLAYIAYGRLKLAPIGGRDQSPA